MTLFDEWKLRMQSLKSLEEYHTFWKLYNEKEEQCYQELLENKDTICSGKLAELAAHFGMDCVQCMGLVGGMNGSLKNQYDLDGIDADTELTLAIDFEKLYRNMLEMKAKHLFELEEWEEVIPLEKRRAIAKEWRSSKILVSEKTVGRNDPCPCGSGLKYKKCCGK